MELLAHSFIMLFISWIAVTGLYGISGQNTNPSRTQIFRPIPSPDFRVCQEDPGDLPRKLDALIDVFKRGSPNEIDIVFLVGERSLFMAGGGRGRVWQNQ